MPDTLDVTHGNMTEAQALRLGKATEGGIVQGHEPGSTEPWISKIVHSFVIATGARSVLETGCFKGRTSVWLADALWRLGGGDLHLCDIDLERLATAGEEVVSRNFDTVKVYPWGGDVITFLRACRFEFDLCFVDDDHSKAHVTRELQFLLPHVRKGGIVLLHDVFGSCDLNTVVHQFGGYSIDLPRLGPAGGLGVIQVR